MFNRLRKFLTREIWLRDTHEMLWVEALWIRALRFVWAIGRDIFDGQLNLRAMSLVYTTLLAIVPLLAFSFSVLKAFGVHNKIEPVLLGFLEPFGERGIEIAGNIIGFVDNVQVGVLGSIGLIILIYTVVALVQKIESGFNYTWRVPQPRSFARRFSGYLSILAVGPLLIFGAIGLLGALRSQTVVSWLLEREPFGTLMVWFANVLPFLLVAAAFTFFYMLVPNTRVKLLPALAGGIVASLLWRSVGAAFAAFMVGSAKYTAIYAGFALPLLLMFWLYLSWLILLIGAQIAFYLQNPQFVAARRGTVTLDHAFKEHLALAVMFLVARDYRADGPVWTFDALSRRLHVNADPLRSVADRLCDAGLLVFAGDDGDRYAPGRDPEAITLFEILDTTRHGSGLAGHGGADGAPINAVDAVQEAVQDAIRGALGDRTLRDLVHDSDTDG